MPAFSTGVATTVGGEGEICGPTLPWPLHAIVVNLPAVTPDDSLEMPAVYLILSGLRYFEQFGS
jgi:hypothetical protein